MGLFQKPPPGADALESEAKPRKAELETLLADLASGAEYQQALLPHALPQIPAYDFGVFFRGARKLSGDFYDFLPLDGGSLGIVVADASGKGIPASLLTMTCRAFFRAQPEPGASPARVVGNVNHMLSGNIKRGMFISVVYAHLNPSTHSMTLANAGHLPMVVWRSKARVATIYPSKSPVLGILSKEAYEAQAQEETVPIGVGDRFLLITDGVNEAMAPGQKEFGMEHLRKRLLADSDGSSASFLKNVVEQIDLHRGGGEQSDDITLVTGRRLS